MNNNNSVGTQKRGFLSPRVLNIIFLAQVVVNIVVLGLIVAGLFFVIGRVDRQAKFQEEATQAQIEFVQGQNDKQLCAQHDIILAVRKLGRGFERALGLPPLTNIDVPDVKGLDCASLSARR
jgi:hypothetical protein